MTDKLEHEARNRGRHKKYIVPQNHFSVSGPKTPASGTRCEHGFVEANCKRCNPCTCQFKNKCHRNKCPGCNPNINPCRHNKAISQCMICRREKIDAKDTKKYLKKKLSEFEANLQAHETSPSSDGACASSNP